LLEALGEDFVYMCGSGILSNKKLKDGGPHTAASKMQYARYVFMDEFPDGKIDDYNLKAILGNKISVNDKFEKERSFEVKSLFMGGCNVRPRIESVNYGTWRRYNNLQMKMVFTYEGAPKNPFDKNNKYHRMVDESIKSVLIKQSEYKEATLAIFIKWLYILKRKYNGNIKRVPKPTIDYETKLYSMEQDVISKFVRERVVKVTDGDLLLPIDDFVLPCQEYLQLDLGVAKIPAYEIKNNIIDSVLKDVTEIVQNNNIMYIKGFRPLQRNTYPNIDEILVADIEQKVIDTKSKSFVSVDFKDMTLLEYLK
jgi:hypothetical protein